MMREKVSILASQMATQHNTLSLYLYRSLHMTHPVCFVLKFHIKVVAAARLAFNVERTPFIIPNSRSCNKPFIM
jgi:hypothetical protein